MRYVPFVLLLLAGGCVKDEAITAPFSDKFERAQLGVEYNNTGAPYEIMQGKLHIKGAYNHPLWLKKKLPRDAVIELDVVSKSPDGDIKIEAWGDGQSYATTRGAYLATSYVFIFGGWSNRESALCRMDEHSEDPQVRQTRKDVKVVPGRTYHFTIKRKGNKVEWMIDGKPFLALDDPTPLEGDRHAYFGFNNWQSDLWFDNLSIKPL